MTEEKTTVVLCESEETKNTCGLEIISLDVDILDKSIHFDIGVADRQAGLVDMVPLARTISTKLALTVLDSLGKNGQYVPCCKGCSACCSCLIPLSVPEVFCLREELLTMPTDDSSRVLPSCLKTAERILDNFPQTFCSEDFCSKGQSSIGQINKWYAGLELVCPFLSEGLCSLYEQRPLACREHIVTDSVFFCKADHKGEPNVVQMPVSILEVLGLLTAELEQSDVEAIMLPLAFAWAEDNLQRSRVTWHAVTMVECFLEIIKLIASKNSAMPALST